MLVQGLDRGNANGTNLVLSRIAITKQSAQNANQFEYVHYSQPEVAMC